MAELSSHELLLLNGDIKHGITKRTPFSASLAKWVLKILMWGIFIAWIALMFFFPIEFVRGLYQKWLGATRETVFGVTGSIFLIFGAAIHIVAFPAFIYVTAFPSENEEMKKPKFPRFRLWTFPVIVDGPFGVVSAAELIGILLFSAYIIWAVSAYAIQIQQGISKFPLPFKEKRCFL
ncbi:ferric reduction oxidase 7, chloroplastic-like [Magnolia sinica]|uniref:ferric reduction oxidase 7, chloroplastic-like n=1 Tax=Magnolia sinica TaxID=86752 RepID=UPI00265AA4C9|nr:ferric reduction oxidase 7, chloroplastic-like [Magnolia sinica]